MYHSRPRILWITESTHSVNSGYSTYSLNILRRLAATQKYDIAELACYGSPEDPRLSNAPWLIYPVQPHPSNQEEVAAYQANPTYQFGASKFEPACIDFMPDIVVAITDIWMFNYACQSIFRPYYRLMAMPAIDAFWQHAEWLYDYSCIDDIFGYTDWAIQLLEKQGGHILNIREATPPGADLNIFKPATDKAEHKKMLGFTPDSHIIGMVARNQKRKLFDDLFVGFKAYLAQLSEEDRAKTFLLLHTTYPDMGYDFPQLLLDYDLGHKVYFTYVCRNQQCNVTFVSPFQDAVSCCPSCHGVTAVMSSTLNGINPYNLAAIYNAMDLYVQYAAIEGFALPIAEAAACGVPVMAVDNSAMSDNIRKLEGELIKVGRFYLEVDTGRYWALPDTDDFIEKLNQFFIQPAPLRLKKGQETRLLCEKYYDYDKTAKVWERYFDSVELKPLNKTWYSLPRTHNPPQTAPDIPSNQEFADWCVLNILGRPDLVKSYYTLKLARDLTMGASKQVGATLQMTDMSYIGMQRRLEPFNRQILVDTLTKMRQHQNRLEQERWNRVRNKS